MNNEKIIELREKILKGIELSFERLVKSKQNKNGDFVFSKEGKIFFIKASEILK